MDEPTTSPGADAPLTITRAQQRFSSALTQVLVSIVVLNLFVEYVHTVIIDSFTVSILTAVLLWLMLRLITRLEHRVAARFRDRKGVAPRVLRLLSTWAILFVSKFVIIEVVALATLGRATLGQFFEVVAIVLVLMAADYLLGRVYRRLGGPRAGGRHAAGSAGPAEPGAAGHPGSGGGATAGH